MNSLLSCLSILFRQSNSWKFEYTGDPEPFAGPGKEDRSDEMNFTGSTGYRNMMGLDITGKEASKRPAAMNVLRKIPANCATDEVLAAVKSAMFEMSDWLLQVEAVEINRKNSDMQDEDDDLAEDSHTAHSNMHSRRSSPSSDPYLDPLDPLNQLLTVTGDGSQLGGLYAVQGQDSSAQLTVSKKEGQQQQQQVQVQHRSISRCGGIEEENENEGYEEERERVNTRGNDEEVSEEYDSDEDMPSSPPGYEDRDLHQHPSSSSFPFPSPSFSPSPFLTHVPSASDTSIRSSAHSQIPTPTLINTTTRTHTRTHTHTRTRAPSDRVSIMFFAFTDATNNKAQWLGKNEKLTRLKFQGGLEKVLRLKMTWQQFDSLWTRVDTQRSGYLSFQEFQNSFYNADDMFSSEGTYDAYVLQDTCSFLLLIICIQSLCGYCFIVYHLSVSDY